MKEPKITVDILGTEYEIKYQQKGENPRFDELDGYVDHSTKEIYIMIQMPNKDYVVNLAYHQNYVLRHEIIHAFLYESGLDSQTNEIEMWARNEEMVDWLAIQFHKIEKVFKELKI